MPNDQLSATELRTLVISILDRKPGATYDRVLAHRSTLGRTLDSAESDQLRDAYATELVNPTGAHRIGAVEAADIARKQPFALRPTEIAGLVAGLLPLVFHLQMTTPSTVTGGTGAVVAGRVYDPVANAGGFLAIILGLIVARPAMHQVSRRAMHVAVVGLILLLGCTRVCSALASCIGLACSAPPSLWSGLGTGMAHRLEGGSIPVRREWVRFAPALTSPGRTDSSRPLRIRSCELRSVVGTLATRRTDCLGQGGSRA